jgi:uncharacterized membrane protein YhaH (DUF805 family)
MQSYLKAMRNYAVFRGRASRAEFWQFYLVYFLIAVVAAFLDQALGTATNSGGLLIGITYFAHLLPQLAVLVRRLHDTDRSGWWTLLALTGFGVIVLLIFACLAGKRGPNRFGPEPLGGDDASARTIGQYASAPAPQPRRDVLAEIERLAQLRANGSLTEAEFEVMKAQALSNGQTA